MTRAQFGKGVLVVLGTTLPALFSYLAAREESNEAKVRAEVAYVTLQETVSKLTEASTKHAEALIDLRARYEVHGHAIPTPLGSIGSIGHGASSRPPRTVSDAGIADVAAVIRKPLKKVKTPPVSFMDAIQQYKARGMRQESDEGVMGEASSETE